MFSHGLILRFLSCATSCIFLYESTDDAGTIIVKFQHKQYVTFFKKKSLKVLTKHFNVLQLLGSQVSVLLE